MMELSKSFGGLVIKAVEADALGITEKDQQECKGLTFRGHTSQFFDYKDRRIEKKQRIRLLKKESCPGCPMCSWFLDDMGDMISTDGLIWPEEIEDGKLYTIRVTNEHRDWESGIVDDYQFEIVEKKGG